MKSKRQDSLWSWGYKNINSRLFCLCFRGLSCRCCVCVRECLEKTASCQSKQRLGTLVSLYHCLVKVCLRGKGGHMCLSKWKRGWWVQTGLVPCRNPPYPTLPIKPFLIYSYHILHNPISLFCAPFTPLTSAFSETNYTFVESWASSPCALHFNSLSWDGHTALTATKYTSKYHRKLY